MRPVSCFPEHLERHGEQPGTHLLDLLAVVEQDAAREPLACGLPEASQSSEVSRAGGRRCLDLDADHRSGRTFQDEIDFNTVLVSLND